MGFLTDRRWQLFVVEVGDPATETVVGGPGARPRRLTEGDQDDTDPVWAPDGAWLAFASARHEGREHDRVRDLFALRPDGCGLRRLTDSSLILSAPAFSPDGGTLLALGVDPGADRSRWIARHTGLFALDVRASGDPARPRRLTDERAHQLTGPRVLPRAGGALVTVERRGAVDLVAVGLDGGDVATVSAGHQQITGFDAAPDGTIVVAVADAGSPGELAALGADRLWRLTDFAAGLRAGSELLPMTELTADAPDGYPVHGFLVEPAGAGPHPVLLLIHGGPFAQYGWTLFDEAQVYAGAGYAVVYGNPRGSSGYGQAHGEAIRGDVGERSAVDLLALLDSALARPELDADRVGVLGGSHGGFMTSWLIGHTGRFRAAVSERAVNAIDSFVGSSDIGWTFAADLYGSDPAAQRRQSPLSYADSIGTPLLIIHSEQDWRCPLEQAQRLYVALRARDAVVEMLLVPGEGHELSRTGLPRHRTARFEAILDWFDRYLR